MQKKKKQKKKGKKRGRKPKNLVSRKASGGISLRKEK